MAITEVEQWLTRTKTDCAGVQETYIGANKQTTNQNYTWYYSGNKQEHCRHGVAFVIRNELKNYIKDIIPINERIMVVKFEGTIDMNIVIAYSPTAAAETIEKDSFYKSLRNEMRSKKSGIRNLYRRLQRKSTNEIK